LRAGEILGLAGLVGSGRTEIAEAIAGFRRTVGGTVEHNGRIAYVSEDRKTIGLHLSLSVRENITLTNLKALLKRATEQNTAEKWISKLGIRTPGGEVRADSLSGGNQQKVSVAKHLEREPSVLILDEPTRGVDIGAKSEMYHLVHNLSKSGLACILISSEMQEVIHLCHRVLVLREQKLVGELQGDTITEQNIIAMAAGIKEGAH
jgi:ribose transport system ATP-binding protein